MLIHDGESITICATNCRTATPLWASVGCIHSAREAIFYLYVVTDKALKHQERPRRRPTGTTAASACMARV